MSGLTVTQSPPPTPTRLYKRRRVALRSYGRSSYGIGAMRPEMKYKDFTIQGATIAVGSLAALGCFSIEQGPDRDQRVGRRVRVSKVQMVGGMASVGFASADIHLWSPRSNSDPTTGDFTSVRGALPLDTGHSWMHWTQQGGTQSRNCSVGKNNSEALNVVKYFPRGLQMYYSGALGTSCDRNRLWFVILCNAITDSIGEYGFTVRVWYYDL